MIVLDSTSKLVVFLAGSVTTNQLEFVASYADKTTTAFTPGRASGATNNTTATDLVTAPSASTQRMVKKIVVHNKDTVSATVTIEEDISAARKRVCKVTLATLDTLEIDDQIRVTDANGNLKETTGFGTQTANYVFAGPSSGSPATPAFRAMVTADIPDAGVTAAKIASAVAGAGLTGGAGTALSVSQPGARVYNTGAQSISNATDTALTFDSERFDTDTIHSTSSNTSRLTATTAGKYVICGHFSFAANATGVRIAYIRLNGTTMIASDIRPNNGAGTRVDITISAIYNLAATDYVELIATQFSGGALNVDVQANWSPEFSMVRVG